jgi:creatinine amidohydrolase/Fe(II)-dependent formamide hydrolase-like protein
MGDASKSTPDKGARLLEHVGHRLIELTREIARFQV